MTRPILCYPIIPWKCTRFYLRIPLFLLPLQKYKDAQKRLEHLNSIKELDMDIKKLKSRKKPEE